MHTPFGVFKRGVFAGKLLRSHEGTSQGKSANEMYHFPAGPCLIAGQYLHIIDCYAARVLLNTPPGTHTMTMILFGIGWNPQPDIRVLCFE